MARKKTSFGGYSGKQRSIIADKETISLPPRKPEGELGIGLIFSGDNAFRNVLNLPLVKSKLLDGYNKSLYNLLLNEIKKVGLAPGKSKKGLCVQEVLSNFTKNTVKNINTMYQVMVQSIEKLAEETAEPKIEKLMNSKKYIEADNLTRKRMILEVFADSLYATIKKSLKTRKSDSDYFVTDNFVDPLLITRFILFGRRKSRTIKDEELYKKFLLSIKTDLEKCLDENEKEKLNKLVDEKNIKAFEKSLKQIGTKARQKFVNYSDNMAKIAKEELLKSGIVSDKAIKTKIRKGNAAVDFTIVNIGTSKRRFNYDLPDIIDKVSKMDVRNSKEETKKITKIFSRLIAMLFLIMIAIFISFIISMIFKISILSILNVTKWKYVLISILKSDKHFLVKMLGLILFLFSGVCIALVIGLGLSSLIKFVVNKIIRK